VPPHHTHSRPSDTDIDPPSFAVTLSVSFAITDEAELRREGQKYAAENAELAAAVLGHETDSAMTVDSAFAMLLASAGAHHIAEQGARFGLRQVDASTTATSVRGPICHFSSALT
jgi:hypothetical protein